MKVYCGECKYFYTPSDEYESEGCKATQNLKKVDTYRKVLTEKVREANVINKQNDCEWFSPRWYVRRKYK